MKRILMSVTILISSFALAVAQFQFEFDYTYDSNNFFSGANIGRRTYLETAGNYLSQYIDTSLTSISPSGPNTWTMVLSDVTDGAGTISIVDPTLAADKYRIYIGAYDMGGGGTLAWGGPGGYSSSGTAGWNDTVRARGVAGALNNPQTEFSRWGGSISFNTFYNWYFDSDISTFNDIPIGQHDFFSVAIHELTHTLGFIGGANPWDTYRSGLTFAGPTATSVYGGIVPLANTGHWTNGLTSQVPVSLTVQEAAMDPDISSGTRKYPTLLDLGALNDIGWNISIFPVPEPSSFMMILAGMGLCMWFYFKLSPKKLR